MANDFEYKIHVSIDQKGLGDDVRKELSKIAQETKDAFKIKLTGDPKDLIKQLVDLKKLVPDLDLTQGIKFELADVIKENTDEGKKLISNFTTYIINSVNDAVSSIDAISESIKKTQDVLEGFKNRKRELLKDDDTASAVSAFEKAEKRLFDASNKFSESKQNKGKLAAAEEMKRAYQDILNYQEEAGREMSEKTKQILGVFAQDVDKTFVDITGKEHSLKDFLGDVKVNSSYKKDLQELESQIFSAENKLRDLKKELENAKNPEMKIKGKLADNFLSDLQAQLDAMTGLEVKVRPKIDEDVKLEVEVNGDVKPIDSPNNSNNSFEIKEKKQEIKEISHDLEDVQQHINNIKPQKTQDEIRVEFEKTRNAVDQTVSSQGSYFESLFEKAKTTKLSYEEVIAVVSEAEKISSQFTKHNLELQDTDFAWADGDWEKYDIGFQGAKSDMDNFKQSLSDTYKLYKNVESAIKNNAGMYKGQFYDNSDLDNLRGIFQIIASYANELGIDINSVIESIPRMTKEFKGLAVDAVLQQMNIKENNRQYDGESEELKNINSQLQERYRLLEKILTITTKDDIGKTVDIEGVLSSGILSDFTDKDFQYGNVQTIVENICKLLGIEIPSAAEKAKEAISETTSASPNTSAMDAVEEELHEEAQAHRENAEAAKADAKAQEEFNSQKNIRKPHDEYRDNQIKFLQDYKKISDEYIELDTRDYDEPLSDKEEKRLDELRVKIKEYDEILKQYSDVRVRLKNGESYSIIDNLDSHDWNTKKSAIKDIVFELKEEVAAANEVAEAENNVIKTRENIQSRNFNKDLEEHVYNASITRPDYEKFSIDDYNQGKKELNDYYDRVISLQDKLNSFSTDHTEQEVKELQDELYDAELEFIAAYNVLNDYSDYRLDKSGKSGGAKQNIKDLYSQINSKYSVEENITEAEPDINKVRDTLGKIMDQMNTSQITGRNLFDWIKENASEAEKELLDVSKGYEEFQKLLVGASFGSKGLFEYRDGAGLDVFNYNKNNLSSDNEGVINEQNRIQEELDETKSKAKEVQEAVNSIQQAPNTARYVHWGSKEQSENIFANPNGMSTGDYGQIQQFCDCLGEAEASSKAIEEYWDTTNGLFHQVTHNAGSALIIDIPLDQVKEFEHGLKDFIPQEYIKGYVDTNTAVVTLNNSEKELLETQDKINQSNKTPVSTKGTSSSISQLEKEAGLRQENVQLTDAQIEAELKRQSEATSKTPLTGDEAIVRYIDELDQMYEKEKLTGEELEKLFAASRNADAGSALELLSSELEKASDVLRPEDLSGNLDKVIGKFKELGISITDIRKLLQGDKTSISWVGTNGDRQENISKAIELLKQLGLEVESVNNPDKFNTTITARTQAQVEAFHQEKQAAEEVKEVVEELVIDLDKLANHPFPTDDIFTNKKIAAEQSIGQLESVLPYDYQGDVRQQIYDLHTELSELTEDEGLSLWRTKFEIVAKSVKNVREEMDALSKNQKKAMSEAVSDANLSKGITKARDDIEKMSESMSELGVTKFDEEFKKLNEELGNVGNNSDKLKIVQAKIDELKIGLREAAAEAEALSNKQKAVYESLRENIIQKAELEAQNIGYERKGMQDTNSYKLNADKINALEEEINAVDRLALSEEQLKSIKEAEAEADKKVQQARDLKQQSDKQAEEANKRQTQTLEKTRAALQKQASSLMNNGKLMKQYGDQVNALYEEIQNPSTTIQRLEQIRVELNKISAEATVAGKSGKSFFQILQQRAQSLLAYLGTFASFYRVVGYVRTAIQTISDLDTQLVDLRKTTQMNTAELNEFYLASTDIGKQLGVTTSEIISQAAAWSRLGYNTKEASETMAALSSKFASISPGVAIDNATDYLVSTMQAFKIQPEEVERTIMDNINAIGNTMATTNGEIGEMLERSSAAMKAANNTLEETIALEAAAVEITRNAETTGTAFRTISMRIRGYDEETEELSADLENISGDIANLTKTTKHAPISIFTDETRTEYKSTYQILKEISEIWNDLTDKQQADLLEKLGGKRGAQSLAGILADFSSVEEALKTMSEAGGSAEREMGIIRESLDFKVNALKQTWVGILQDLVDRGVIGNFVDALTNISEALGDILSKFGLIKTAIAGIAGIIGSQKLG